MGLRHVVAKTILTQIINKGALGCTTPAELVEFVLVLGKGVERASLKECEAAFLWFPPHVVTKISQGGRFESEECCCKKDLNTTNYTRRTRVYNTGRMLEFVRALGEGVKGASLKECEAAFLRFPPHVVTKILQRGRYGSDGWSCKKNLNRTHYARRTRVYNTGRIGGICSSPG